MVLGVVLSSSLSSQIFVSDASAFLRCPKSARRFVGLLYERERRLRQTIEDPTTNSFPTPASWISSHKRDELNTQ